MSTWAAETKDRAKNLEKLLEVLKYHEVKKVEVRFDGENDSGALELGRVEMLDPDAEMLTDEFLKLIKVPGTKMGTGDAYIFNAAGQAVKRDWITHPLSLFELLIGVAEEELEHRHGGWEINAGAHGKVVFEPLAVFEKRQVFFIDFIEKEGSYDYDDEEYNDE